MLGRGRGRGRAWAAPKRRKAANRKVRRHITTFNRAICAPLAAQFTGVETLTALCRSREKVGRSAGYGLFFQSFMSDPPPLPRAGEGRGGKNSESRCQTQSESLKPLSAARSGNRSSPRSFRRRRGTKKARDTGGRLRSGVRPTRLHGILLYPWRSWGFETRTLPQRRKPTRTPQPQRRRPRRSTARDAKWE